MLNFRDRLLCAVASVAAVLTTTVVGTAVVTAPIWVQLL